MTRDARPYSERKLREVPWEIEKIVAAQNMRCAGKSYFEIAKELGEPLDTVQRRMRAWEG